MSKLDRVQLAGKHVRDIESNGRKGERTDGLAYLVSRAFAIRSAVRLAMNLDAEVGQVDDPIVLDAGGRVQFKFFATVIRETRFGDFD